MAAAPRLVLALVLILALGWPPPAPALLSPPRAARPRTAPLAASGSDKGFRLLELLPSQQVLVKTASFGWREAFRIMLKELAPQSDEGEYVRPDESINGALGSDAFPAEPGRYRLYVGNPCPWCHRVTLALALNGIGPSVLPVTNLADAPTRARRGGWACEPPDEASGNSPDLKGVYDFFLPGTNLGADASRGSFSGRCTAPLLVDVAKRRIVTNNSRQMVRGINRADFGAEADAGFLAGGLPDLVPAELEADIDALNELLQRQVNNGVYRCGFSTSQRAYDRAASELAAGLDHCEALLGQSRFLLGEHVTESDVMLLPTVVRLDSIYATIFRANVRRVGGLPALRRWAGDMMRIPGVRATFDEAQARESYARNLFPLTPSGIVPAPPAEVVDLLEGGAEDADFARTCFRWRRAPAAAGV